MCALRIISNADLWTISDNQKRFGHLGTRDRANPSISYDHPGKTNALLTAAQSLQSAIAAGIFHTHLAPLSMTISTRYATSAEALRAHPEEYLNSLETASSDALERAKRGEDPIAPFGKEADVSPGTDNAALRSVGAALDAVDTVLSDASDTAFALVWPPGHHAEPIQAMGFCYLSTAAIAALYARDHSVQIRAGHKNRVVLIDIDHHRGNGSAAVLANQPEVLFIDQAYRSHYDPRLQRYVDGPYDPATDTYEGAGREFPYEHTDKFLGVTAHPMASAPNIHKVEFEGFQSAETVIRTFFTRVMPAVKEFNPDVILWSVGLDSAKGDPVGGLGLEPESFYTFIKGMRLAFPDIKHCGILEGGYHPELGAACIVPTLLGFHDAPEQICYDSFSPYQGAFKK